MRLIDKIVNVGILVMVVVVGYLLVRPGHGPVAIAIEKWRGGREMSRLLESSWNSLSDGTRRSGQALGEGRENPTTAVIFFDYECPFCLRLEKELQTVAQSGLARGIVIRHFPLPSHPAAREGAVAAICADKIGEFQPMHRYLTSGAWQSSRDYSEIALAASLTDVEGFEHCLASGFPDSVLAHDKALGDLLRVTGTPTILTRRQRVDGFVKGDSLLTLMKDS